MNDLKNERGPDGLLTTTAMAIGKLEEHGCDCVTDDPGICLYCLCENAIKEERIKIYCREMRIRDLKETYSDRIAHRDLIISRLEKEINGLRDEKIKLPSDCNRLQQRVDELKEFAKDLEREIDSLRLERDGLRDDKIKLLSDCDGLQQRIDELKQFTKKESELDAVKAERDGLLLELAESRRIKDEQRRIITRLRHERDEAREGLSYWRDESSVRLNISLEVAARVRELEAERDGLREWVAKKDCERPHGGHCNTYSMQRERYPMCEPCQARASQRGTD